MAKIAHILTDDQEISIFTTGGNVDVKGVSSFAEGVQRSKELAEEYREAGYEVTVYVKFDLGEDGAMYASSFEFGPEGAEIAGVYESPEGEIPGKIHVYTVHGGDGLRIPATVEDLNNDWNEWGFKE